MIQVIHIHITVIIYLYRKKFIIEIIEQIHKDMKYTFILKHFIYIKICM